MPDPLADVGPPPQPARTLRLAVAGLVINTAFMAGKLFAGIVGNSTALIADAVESMADILASLVVWRGLAIAQRDADERYPFGYHRAETLAATAVALLLLAAAAVVVLEAVTEMRRPHAAPAAWTLVVLAIVVVGKLLLSRVVGAAALETSSPAVQADATHHVSDAVTSAAAFLGISITLWGGPTWVTADEWAALLAAGVIAWNGAVMLRQALGELMDRAPSPDEVAPVRRAAERVPGVRAIEKLIVRAAGTRLHVDVHVQADPSMSLADAHALGGAVKAAVRRDVPRVFGVLVHMEPFDGALDDSAARSTVAPGAAP
ncbi:MAG: cation diffusion facilitator family transporter [Gemmatimonadaceae bacterium]|jgi:cation diffusion facilitator family transporter|nr:cation diffusion facilitator family transporter [Gemmatimonadaceae bacterium]